MGLLYDYKKSHPMATSDAIILSSLVVFHGTRYLSELWNSFCVL